MTDHRKCLCPRMYQTTCIPGRPDKSYTQCLRQVRLARGRYGKSRPGGKMNSRKVSTKKGIRSPSETISIRPPQSSRDTCPGCHPGNDRKRFRLRASYGYWSGEGRGGPVADELQLLYEYTGSGG